MAFLYGLGFSKFLLRSSSLRFSTFTLNELI